MPRSSKADGYYEIAPSFFYWWKSCLTWGCGCSINVVITEISLFTNFVIRALLSSENIVMSNTGFLFFAEHSINGLKRFPMWLREKLILYIPWTIGVNYCHDYIAKNILYITFSLLQLKCIFNLFRLFKNPVPSEVVIFNEVTTFRIAVERQLKSKCRLPVTVNFRGDVYRCLFKHRSVQDGWHLLDKAAFPRKFFPEFWDHCPDSHGQGVKVFYPMKMRSFISWSPKKYSVGEGHHQCPRAFQEKLTFSFIRVALGDAS